MQNFGCVTVAKIYYMVLIEFNCSILYDLLMVYVSSTLMCVCVYSWCTVYFIYIRSKAGFTI